MLTPNGTTHERYKGMDITLMTDICEILNCTFRVRTFPYARPGESWTSILYRETAASDVLLNYWTPTASRRDVVNFIYAHIQATRFLISLKPTYHILDWTEKCWTFLHPFSGALWVLVLIVTMLYSWGIWFVEKDSE